MSDLIDAVRRASDAAMRRVVTSRSVFRPNRMWISPALYTFLGGRIPGSGKHGRKRTSRERRVNRQRAMQRGRRRLRWVAPPIEQWSDVAPDSVAAWFLSGQQSEVTP